MTATRRPFFCGNWKLHGTVAESTALARAVADGVANVADADVAVAPSFLSIPAVVQALHGSRIAVSGQDCFWEDKGAFTGEVSVPQLADVGCKMIIIGHSERRAQFGDTDAAVSLKAKAVLKHGLVPIICVGETLEERDSGATLRRVQTQVDAALDGLTEEQANRILVAYEPVWAIGTGRNATPAQAQEVHECIRARVAGKFAKAAESLRILYGGSVKPDNIRDLMSEKDVDGALVGGASLVSDSFIRIVTEGTKAWSRS